MAVGPQGSALSPRAQRFKAIIDQAGILPRRPEPAPPPQPQAQPAPPQEAQATSKDVQMEDEYTDVESWGDLSMSQLDAIDPPLPVVKANTPPSASVLFDPARALGEAGFPADTDDSGSEDAHEVDSDIFVSDEQLACLSTQDYNILISGKVELPEELDDDDEEMREADEDLPLRRRRTQAQQREPLRPLFARPAPVPVQPLTRQTTTTTLRSASSSESIEALLLSKSGRRGNSKRRYSDVDTEATSQSTSNDSPKRRQLSGQASWAPGGGGGASPIFLSYDEQHLSALAQLPFVVGWEIARRMCAPQFPLASLLLDDPALAESAARGVEFLHSLPGGNAKLLAKLQRDGVLKELDTEDDVLAQDPFGCLGGLRDNPYYGGKVMFSANIKVLDAKALANGGSEGIAIVLNEPTVGPSTRLTRRFGSDRVIRLRVPDVEGITSILDQPFILHHHVYRAFFGKEGTAFLIRTDETLKELGIYTGSLPSPYKPHRTALPKLTVDSLMTWANNPILNCHQVAGKWAARMSLFLSSSVPGFRVKKQNLRRLPDIAGEGCRPGEKVPTEKCMTDGCGFMNRAALEACQKRLDQERLVAGYQGRIAGAKGLFIRHPADDDFSGSEEPIVWIRPSQDKIKYPALSPEEVDPAFLTFDILQSATTIAARLSTQLILNLASNGVPPKVFSTLQRNALDELARNLTTWEGDRAMPNLAAKLEQRGQLFARRQAAIAVGAARARGHRSREADDAMQEDADTSSESALAVCFDNWEEVCLRLLHAGFQPQGCQYLHILLQRIIKMHIESFVKDYHIDLPLSASAFIAPDPLGILQEGQIFFHPRSFTLKDAHGHEFDDNVLTGDVLVGRHPCLLPTDVRKVVAVDSFELRKYRNLILFSTKGTRSLANILAGGDYDGDTVVAIWQPEVVQAFRNAPLRMADPPESVAQCFDADAPTVEDLLANGAFRDLQHSYLLAGLKKTHVGMYSNFHLLCCYLKGYVDKETRRLAHIAGQLLDAPKSGKRLIPSVWDKDKTTYKGRMPACFAETAEAAKRAEFNNENFPSREDGQPAFVLDLLKQAGKAAADNHLENLEQLIPSPSDKDLNLIKPYFVRRENAARQTQLPDWMDHLELVRSHVDAVFDKYKKMNAEYAKGKDSHMSALQTPSKKKATRSRTVRSPSKRGEPTTIFADSPTRQRQLQELRAEFNSGPVLPRESPVQPEDLPMLRASYAYYKCTDTDNDVSGRFAFDMAPHELCKIKVDALGPGTDYHVLCDEFFVQMRSAYIDI